MKRGVAGLLAGVAILFAGLAWLRPQGGEVDAPLAPRAVEAAPSESGESEVHMPGAVPPSRLPASLAGTSEDGAFVLDAEGRFVPTPDAIDLFDYYLAAVGEEPDARIRARIVAAIEGRLEGEAAEAAEQLLDAYLVYRARAAELLSGPLLGEDLERRLQYIRELRREVFGAEVARALFGDEEARWVADLERRRLANDTALEPEEREQRLAALEAEQPDAVRAAREAARAHRLLRSEEALLRAEGAGPIEIAQLREQRFGADAAARLSALDAARAGWQTRLDAYRGERDALLAGTSREEHGGLLEEIRARHFENGELVRVRALDRAQQQASGR